MIQGRPRSRFAVFVSWNPASHSQSTPRATAFCTVMRFFSRPRPAASPVRRGRDGIRRFIFLYHRIATPLHDPFALAVPPEWFEDHLDILKSQCQLVSLDEILDTGAAKSARLASITFDDGYTDNLTTASPILRLAGIPVTFFICTGSLGDRRGFWWDRIASAIAVANASSAECGLTTSPSLMDDLSSPEARRNATLKIAGRLQRMHPLHRDRVVADLENVLLAGASGERESSPVLDEAGLRELGSQPLAQLGAHTDSHPMLSVLTHEEQLAEINRSVEKLQEIMGTRPRFVAYPYGGEQDYNSDSCRAARDAALEAGFVNHAAPFEPACQPFRIPRYYVPPLPAEEFRPWLLQILHA
jgi:peptidoglycan/xylan/chitin deacetylase (PgdA/CDA1 family)